MKYLKFTQSLAIASCMALNSANAATLLFNDFGGGADTGPSFQQLYNGQGVASADTSTGTVSTTSTNNASIGFNTSGTVDASADPGFTITWAVSSFSNTGDITFNGFFFGVTNDKGNGGANLWNNTAEAVGILLDGGSAQPDWSLVERTGDPADGILSASASLGVTPNDFSVSDNDGFTVSMTINSDNTWSASSTGMLNNISASGTLGASSYATIAGSLVANTTIQGGNTSPGGLEYVVDSVSITTIPEPSSLLMLSMIGLLALRRRRS